MRDTSNRPAAPDFTAACIVMFGINLSWFLVLIWALWGIAAVALTGWAVNALIGRIEARRV